jgi:hypothetical protein
MNRKRRASNRIPEARLMAASDGHPSLARTRSNGKEAPIAVTAACRASLGQYLAGRAENFLSLKALTKAPKTKTTTAASRDGNIERACRLRGAPNCSPSNVAHPGL